MHANTTSINYLRNYNIKNLCLGNNQLAIVNTLKNYIAIKSGEQYVNERSLNNVNFLVDIFHLLSFICTCIRNLFDCILCEYKINHI